MNYQPRHRAEMPPLYWLIEKPPANGVVGGDHRAEEPEPDRSRHEPAAS